MIRWLLLSVISVVGAALIALGAAIVYLPAGLIVGGAELVLSAYVAADLTSPSLPADGP